MDDLHSEDEDSKHRGGATRKAGFGDNYGSKGKRHGGGGGLDFISRIFRVYYWMSRDRNTSK